MCPPPHSNPHLGHAHDDVGRVLRRQRRHDTDDVESGDDAAIIIYIYHLLLTYRKEMANRHAPLSFHQRRTDACRIVIALPKNDKVKVDEDNT